MKQQTDGWAEAGTARQMRNGLCACGSGVKYKKCCGAASSEARALAITGAHSDPRGAQQQFLRGVQLLRSGQISAAISVLLAAIQSDAAHFDAHHALGSAFMQAGQFGDATEILAHAVALRPNDAAAYADLGGAYDQLNLHEQAIAAYRRAVELKPNLGDVHHRLGQLYAMYSRTQEAADCFDRAADARRNTTQARMYRSDAQLLRGDIAGAEQWVRKAIALDPTNDAAQRGLAGLLYNQGRFEEAATYFESALRLNPQRAQCWDGLVHCRKYSAADNSIVDRMRAVLQRNDLPESERMTMHFALGKVLDDCGDYARAMEQFDAANRLRARQLPFDRASLAALVDRNIQLFTKDFIARHAASGAPDDKPVFIVGMFRSGTSLVEQILSSHPDIAGGGELAVWTPMDTEIDAATGDFNPRQKQAAIAKYLSAVHRIGPAAARVTDKLPSNFFRLGAIHALLPNARIIHCQRDAIDTCLSIYSTLFSTRMSFAAQKGDLAYYYRQYRRMMDHWRKVLPAACFLDIEYERLIMDREAETKRLLNFIGIGWNDLCLRPEQNMRSVSTSSAWQVRQPVYATSMQRWRRYEPWLGELRQLLPR